MGWAAVLTGRSSSGLRFLIAAVIHENPAHAVAGRDPLIAIAACGDASRRKAAEDNSARSISGHDSGEKRVVVDFSFEIERSYAHTSLRV